MFNQDQLDYMKYLSRIPNHKLCACGWHLREECEGGYMEKHCGRRAAVAKRQARERADDVR